LIAKKWLAIGAAVATGAGMIAISSASANLPGSTFDAADANIRIDGNETDWASFVGSPSLSVGTDQPTGQTDNSFTQGSKEDDVDVVIGLGSIPNSKADLGKFAVASETLGASAGANQGHVMMYLAWTRNNLSGTTNFDFEINQATQPNMTIAAGQPDRAVHLNRIGDAGVTNTPGGPLVDDVLINYDVQGGAQNPTLSFRRWTGTQWSAAINLSQAGFAEGSINTGAAIPPGESGPFGGAIQASAFGEGAIDLTAAGIIADQDDPNAPCTGFGSAYVKSRSSNAFTAQMKDYIAPVPLNLNTCGSLTIDKVTIPSGDPQSFNFNASWKADFQLTDQAAPNVTTGLTPGNYTVTEDVPTGWTLTSATCSDGTDLVASAGVVNVGPLENVTCTFTNTGLANLRIVKDAERPGVNFDFTAAAPLSPAAFDLADGEQQDFLGLGSGTYSVTEDGEAGWDNTSSDCVDTGTTNPRGTAASVTLAAGDDVTCTFVNVIERGAVLIHKTAKHAAAPGGQKNHEGVTFTVANANNGTNTAVVTDAAGLACVANVPVSVLDGDYTITETLPAGYHSDDLDQTYTVVADTTCATATAAEFVNIPLTNITVSVDSQIDGGTASVINCGGTNTGSTGANGDGSVTVNDLEPTAPGVTLTCTVVVDP
jgi:Prealbumin-like fold domain